MVDLARPDIRGKVYAGGKIPGIGFARVADEIALDGIVDSSAFENAAAGAGDFVDGWQYRPGQVDPDRVKSGSVISGDKWMTEAPNYSDARTDLAYEAVGLIHPDIFNECIRLALRHVYLSYYWPLGWHLDNDFAAALTTTPHDWTSGAVNMTTIAKSSTGGVYTQAGQTGPRNLVLSGNGSGNGYVISSRLNVEPSDMLFHGAIGRVNGAYTGSYVLYDVTNAAALETVTFQSRAFQRIAMTTGIPAGCRQVEVRIGNVTASGVTEWDCLFGHLLGHEMSELILPSWLTKRFQFLSFGPSLYLGRNTGTHMWNATARQILAWYSGIHYEPLTLDADASLTKLEIRKGGGLEANEYWLQAKRPHSSFEELVDEDETTNAEEDYLMAAVYKELAEVLFQDYGEDRYERLLYWAESELARQRIVRASSHPQAPRGVIHIGLRR